MTTICSNIELVERDWNFPRWETHKSLYAAAAGAHRFLFCPTAGTSTKKGLYPTPPQKWCNTQNTMQLFLIPRLLYPYYLYLSDFLFFFSRMFLVFLSNWLTSWVLNLQCLQLHQGWISVPSLLKRLNPPRVNLPPLNACRNCNEWFKKKTCPVARYVLYRRTCLTKLRSEHVFHFDLPCTYYSSAWILDRYMRTLCACLKKI